MSQESNPVPASPTPSESARAGTATLEAPQSQRRASPMWNVVLLDDNEHTYEYVVEMVCDLFRRTPEEAFAIARTVDVNGRAVCMTTHKELAELKRDQITAFGADPLSKVSRGSMGSIIEPATADDHVPGSGNNSGDGKGSHGTP